MWYQLNMASLGCHRTDYMESLTCHVLHNINQWRPAAHLHDWGCVRELLIYCPATFYTVKQSLIFVKNQNSFFLQWTAMGKFPACSGNLSFSSQTLQKLDVMCYGVVNSPLMLDLTCACFVARRSMAIPNPFLRRCHTCTRIYDGDDLAGRCSIWTKRTQEITATLPSSLMAT